MATFHRAKGTLYEYSRPVCDTCSTYDAQGFTTNLPDDPPGQRCWAPRWSSEFLACPGCGQDVNRHIPWDTLVAPS